MDRVLLALLAKNDFVSGEEIGRKLSISRAAVWKHIESIKERGFEVDAVSGKGYRISHIPKDKLIPERVVSRFEEETGQKWEMKFLSFPALESTNNLAKQLAIKNSSKQDNVLVITDSQTGGRGRLQRLWVSQPGKDLTFTLSLAENKEVNEFYKFTMMASVAVRETAESVVESQTPIGIKWPNDIYAGEKKVCGILSEMITEQNLMQRIIIGIGINVNSKREEKTDSLSQLKGAQLDLNEVLAAFLVRFHEVKALYEQNRFEEVYRRWREHLIWVGKEVVIHTGRSEIRGILSDVMPDGGVLLKMDGQEKLFYSGDLMGS